MFTFVCSVQFILDDKRDQSWFSLFSTTFSHKFAFMLVIKALKIINSFTLFKVGSNGDGFAFDSYLVSVLSTSERQLILYTTISYITFKLLCICVSCV